MNKNRSSLCQFCFNFVYEDSCTKPNIEGAVIEPTLIKNSMKYGSYVPSFCVDTCPLFIPRYGLDWQEIKLINLCEILRMTMNEFKNTNSEEIKNKLLSNKLEFAIIKKKYYIRKLQ